MWWRGWPVERRGQGRKWCRHRQPPGRELVGDCEAFLAGHVAERIEERPGADVPVWAWTNLLAHGTEYDLRSERTAVRGTAGRSRDKWREARSYLASEVIDLADECGPLIKMQRAVLVPLELDFACQELTAWGPRQWVAIVETALSQHRRASRRWVTRDVPPSQ